VTTEQVTLFLAQLAVVAEFTVVVFALLAIGGLFSTAIARARTLAVQTVAPAALGIAFAVAAVSMAGSLYFSEVAHFVPCKLCWYQRIAMYPLVPLLGIAALRRDTNIRTYGIALAGIGALISTYHVLLERFPSLESGACDPNNPCTLIWVERFDYLTIPTMALSGFAAIIVLLVIAGRDHERDDDEESTWPSAHHHDAPTRTTTPDNAHSTGELARSGSGAG